MPISRDKSAPYAPAKAILDVVERHRSKGLPTPVDKEVLGRAGISDSLIPRTLQALQVLDLVDEDGGHTETLEALRLAAEGEYQQRLREWLNAAYADVLQFVDPATDSETKVRDAFRPFNPKGMQDRMVTLFIGLYAAAGVRQEKDKAKPNGSSQRLRSVRPTERKSSIQVPTGATPSTGNWSNLDVPPAVLGLIKSLPPNGEGWPQARRDSFVKTFEAVIDFCFPIVLDETTNENGGPTG
ncbi:MAG: DUF5343 domain-containing protein [Amaricoccus sp.]